VATLADFLASLALGILKWWSAREDLKRAERQKLILESLELENAALTWLAEARLDPARWSKLRVLHGSALFESFTPLPADAAGRGVVRARRPGGVVRRDTDG